MRVFYRTMKNKLNYVTVHIELIQKEVLQQFKFNSEIRKELYLKLDQKEQLYDDSIKHRPPSRYLYDIEKGERPI